MADDTRELKLTRRQADNARQAIRVGHNIRALQDHIEGKKELSHTQIRSIEILLKKALPDLSATELAATIDKPERELTDAELHMIAGGKRA